MLSFEGKTAIVTGAASGIGEALCAELARQGARVVVTDRNPDGAADVVQKIQEEGGKATSEYLDVIDPDGVETVIDSVVARYGRLDLMINNAGVGIAAEMKDLDVPNWQRIVDINFYGALYGSLAAYRRMVDQGGGHIVNIASLAGIIPLPTSAPYSATKHALVGLSLSLRHEGIPYGVGVTVVCPGYIKTPFYDKALVLNADRQRIFGNIPFKMMAPEKAARLVLRGVHRNKTILVFPFVARLAWWLHRIHPGLLTPFHRKIVEGFHAARE